MDLSATEVRTLIQAKRVLPFYCKDCLQIVKEITELKVQLMNIRKDVDVLKENENQRKQSYAEVLRVKTEAQEIKGGLHKLQEKVEKIDHSEKPITVEPNIVEELCEREKRASNILFFGVPETHTQNREEKTKQENKKVAELLKQIDESIAVEEISTFRLGKPENNKLRPIKVVLPDKKIAKDILRQRNKLNVGGVYIKGDLTVMQRSYLRDVLAELKRRTEAGEANLKIRYYNSIPKIVKVNGQQPKN